MKGGGSTAVWKMLKQNCTIGTGRLSLYLYSINIVSIALDRICSFWCRAISRVSPIHSKLFTFLTFIWRSCAGGCSLAAMKCILKPEGLRSSGLLRHLKRIGILLSVLFDVLWFSFPPKSMPISSPLTVFLPMSSLSPTHLLPPKGLGTFTQLVKVRGRNLALTLPNVQLSWNFHQIISGTKYEQKTSFGPIIWHSWQVKWQKTAIF